MYINHQHDTRNRANINGNINSKNGNIPKVIKLFFLIVNMKSPQYRAAKFYNILPLNIKPTTNIKGII